MSTLLHRLNQVLRDTGLIYNSNDQIAPVAVLWTDGERQWEPLVAQWRNSMPNLFTLGDYDPSMRMGPAIYLKTVLGAVTLNQPSLEHGSIPILYLPGVFRHDLRAVEDCPSHLQPLAELQFRGTCFVQRSGSDWTVYAFLVNPEYGLGLDVAKDQATQTAIGHALLRLADAPLGALLSKRLEASDFQDLAHSDLPHTLLSWLNAPEAQQAALAGNDWALFAARCAATYGFNANTGDARLDAARRLGTAEGPWAHIWARYAAMPRAYPHIAQALRQAKPGQMLLALDSHWPQDNEDGEAALRSALAALAAMPPHLANARVLSLELEHSQRRTWVWASLGLAPLAGALKHVAIAAGVMAKGLPSQDLTSIITAYRDYGWRADAAITKAIDAVRGNQDLELVTAVIHAIYPDWLNRVNGDFANRFQATPIPASPVGKAPGRCIVFADGLRYDVGQALATALREAGMQVDAGWSCAALPTVTATAKPAQAPLTHLLAGGTSPADFSPIIAATGKPLTSESFRVLMAKEQVQVLANTVNGDPSGCAWTEHGTLDHAGHAEEIKLCRRINEEVESLRERISDLLQAGWSEIIVTTDHGWMLVPGNLPKQDLPTYLTETKWSRSAVVKPGNDLKGWPGSVMPWAWNNTVSIAMPPGCHSFIAGRAYSHGGLSLQECVLPRLTVRRGTADAALVRIRSCTWRGLRAVVGIAGAPAGSIASIRMKAGDPSTTISSQGVPLTSDPAEARLLIADDSAIGQGAFIVVCDAAGTVLAKRLVTVGEGESS